MRKWDWITIATAVAAVLTVLVAAFGPTLF
jgi:hypothetical protein